MPWPNVNIGFGVSTGPFVAGFTTTLSKIVIPLLSACVFAGPVSVSSFVTTFDPNAVALFVADAPNLNWKPANAGFGAADSVVVGLLAVNPNVGFDEPLPNMFGMLDVVDVVDVTVDAGVDVTAVDAVLPNKLPDWDGVALVSGIEPKLNVLPAGEPNVNFELDDSPKSFFPVSFAALPSLGVSQHAHFSTSFAFLLMHDEHSHDELFCCFAIDINTLSGCTTGCTLSVATVGFDTVSTLLVEGKTVEFPNEN